MRSLESMRFALLVCACFLSLASGAEAPTKPNVLFVVVDDLRPLLGCYGSADIQSPNLDRLAASGLLFRHAYAQVANCAPSRRSFLGGLRPEHESRRPDGAPTLPQLFRSRGYTTVTLGKINHGHHDDPAGWVRRHPETLGESDGWNSGYKRPENLAGITNYLRGKPGASSVAECVDAPDETYPDGKVAAAAIAELRALKKTGEPFLLAAGFYRPHMPCTAPKKYWDLYPPESIRLPPHFRTEGTSFAAPWSDELDRYGDVDYPLPEDKAREIIRGYYASVSFVDAQIGKVLDELKRLDLDRSTIVTLIGDHGFILGSHGYFGKGTCAEDSVGAAMMVRVPWLPAGRTTDAPTELLDLYPTLCALCAIPPPAHLEGLSFAGLFEAPERHHRPAAFSMMEGGRIMSLRTDRYRYTALTKGSPREELYDHQSNPLELENIAGQAGSEATLTKMRELMANHASGAAVTKPPAKDKQP